MVDTAGTLCKAAEVLVDAGAKSVRAIISHGVLSGNAYLNIGSSVLTELVISDSLPLKNAIDVCVGGKWNEAECVKIRNGFDKIKVVSVAKQIGYATAAINNDSSYEELKIK